METKWNRYRINQISGICSMLDNLIHNQDELFSREEMDLLVTVMGMLKAKGDELRGGSPGGG